MKRILAVLALLVALGATAGAAQARVSVSIGFGTPAPYVAYHPRPYYQPYVVYYPRPLIVIGRPAYHPARVIVIAPRRHHYRRHRRFHGYR
jgi:hypothetical protein